MMKGELRMKSWGSVTGTMATLVDEEREYDAGRPWRARARDGVAGKRARSEKSPRASSRRRRLRPSRRRPMLARHRAEVDILEVRLRGLEAGAGRRVAVDAHDRASGEQLGRDHRVLPLQLRQLRPSRSRGARSAHAGPRPRAAARPRAGSRPRSMMAMRVHSSLTSSTMCVERRTTLFSPSSLSRLRKRTRSAGIESGRGLVHDHELRVA